MRKLLVGLACLFGISVSTAQMVTYLDKNGAPFMYSSKVGGQTVYMDNNGKPVAYQSSVGSGPRVDPINTPSLIFPMVSPLPSGSGTIKALPTLPELPTLRGL